MANFLVVVDPDPERRKRFLEITYSLLSIVDGLTSRSLSSNGAAVIWAAGEHAPIDTSSDESGLGVIWGDAIQAGDGLRMTAQKLRRLWKNPKEELPPILDGFHAACTIDQHQRVTIGADPLGIFPVYYCAIGEVLLVGSSPELFRRHPKIRTALDPEGLVGILATNGLYDGRTLLNGVTRLAPGHLLQFGSGSGPIEYEQYTVPTFRQDHDIPVADQVSRMSQAIAQSVEDLTAGTDHLALLLSGGRDSRMLAGYLRDAGKEVTALTFGVSTDTDLMCAQKLAKALCIKQHTVDVAPEAYVDCAEMSARWEHLAGGFNNITDWSCYSALADLPDRTVLGALSDAIVGGSSIDAACSSSDHAHHNFNSLFRYMNGRAIPVSELGRLVRPETFDGLVPHIEAACRSKYEGYSDLEHERAFRFMLEHSERLHVGSMAWACSFWSWPIMPVCHTQVLEVVAGMSPKALANRRAQDAIMCSRFSELAALPLDRNSYDRSPLAPQNRSRRLRLLRSGLGWLFSWVPITPTDALIETRYYHRIWDVNNRGWCLVRERVESHREAACEYLNGEVLDELLPPPDQRVQVSDVIAQGSAARLLTGFLAWLSDH